MDRETHPPIIIVPIRLTFVPTSTFVTGQSTVVHSMHRHVLVSVAEAILQSFCHEESFDIRVFSQALIKATLDCELSWINAYERPSMRSLAVAELLNSYRFYRAFKAESEQMI